MSAKQECQECQKYKEQGHNYCRMCGFYLTKGYFPFVPVAEIYRTDEKFCGYCGKPRNECKC
jgi:RNA polymerase subunit RPABC4/transcription elongation factor Spt4